MNSITIFSIWNKTYYLCSVVYKHFNIITGQVTAKASALLFGVLVRIINKKVYLHNDNKKELFSKS